MGWVALGGVVLSFSLMPTMSSAANATSIVVSTSQDVVNGDTSSVSALLANPGVDGVSLREAILATNNSPGTYNISFAPSLAGATISLATQLPPLSGGGVTINGDINGNGKAQVTLVEAPGIVGTTSAFQIASSSNTLNAIGLSGFMNGVDIDPPPLNSDSLATHETFTGNTVSNMDMTNIKEFGVIMGSMYLLGCGLFGGSATPCTTNDTWANTTISGNSIQTLDTGFAIKDSGAGDTFSNTTVTNNVITVQGNDGAISFEIGSNATGSTVSGAVISHNTITGQTGEGIDVGPGTNRATGNSMSDVQILDNVVNLTNAGTDICCQGIVLLAGTDGPSATYPNVLPLGYPDANSLSNVLVQGNVVTGTLTSGILIEAGLGAGGSFNTISSVAINDNQVTSTMAADGIDIVNGGGTPLGGRVATSNQISSISLVANRVSMGAVVLQPANGYGAIDLVGGANPSTSNSISTVSLVNNVVTSPNSAIVVVGGEVKSAMTSGNSVQGVQLMNDTIVNPSGVVLDVTANRDGNSSNSISGLSVVNCILWGSIEGEVTASMLRHDLVKQSSWARRNGNVTGNPKFVNMAKGSYQLLAKSPARGKGTSAGAPATDFAGRTRTMKHIDIGAYQNS